MAGLSQGRAVTAALASGRRMRCERYRADIAVATCIARQKRAAQAWRLNRSSGDPGCRDCNQGIAVAVESGIRMPAARGAAHAPSAGEREGKMSGTAVATKRCIDCGEEKPVASGFYKRGRRCRECTNKRYWRLKKERLARRQKAAANDSDAWRVPAAGAADAADRPAPSVRVIAADGVVTVTIALSEDEAAKLIQWIVNREVGK